MNSDRTVMLYKDNERAVMLLRRRNMLISKCGHMTDTERLWLIRIEMELGIT